MTTQLEQAVDTTPLQYRTGEISAEVDGQHIQIGLDQGRARKIKGADVLQADDRITGIGSYS